MTEMTAEQIEQEARDYLAPFGFVLFGWFREEGGKPALLIGNAGSGIWEPFQRSEEFQDGRVDPLNRWTEKSIQPIVDSLHAEVRFPFGNKIWPFQEYAKRATGVRQSPIGLLIHPEFGLWTAFRAVLVFAQELDFLDSPTLSHPCSSCAGKPCLNTCPVGAFSTNGYDYRACRNHIGAPDGMKCRADGCLARIACPVGRQYVYCAGHQKFHMEAFVRA